MIRFSLSTPPFLWAGRTFCALLAAGVFVSAPLCAEDSNSGPTLPPPAPLFASPIAAASGETVSPAAPNADTGAGVSSSGGGGNGSAAVATSDSASAPGNSPPPTSAATATTSSAYPTSTSSGTSASGSTLPSPGPSPLPSASAPPQPAYNANVTSSYNPPPSAFSPGAPPPLPDNTLQNAVRTEAEQTYYDKRRKRTTDTFERAYEGLVPLGPNEVRDVMSRYERTQKASVPPASGQPRGQVRIKTLSLEPGADPPTVNVAAGYVTTITILDATGQPWPIMDLGIGGNFEVSKTGGGTGSTHVVRIMPLTRFGYGNLSVLLQDLSTPIIFKLAAGGTTVDYRFDARVPRLGPNAKLSLIERKQLEAGSPLIMTFLDDSPPPDAKRVRLTGADARTKAWMINERMFVRTPLTMLSPSWDASVSSADGTTVYELTQTPVLLMSDGGALIRAHVLQQKEDE